MKNITRTMYLGGIIIISYSIIRWGGFIYDDLSQMGLGILIGIIICGFAYLNEWMNLKDLKIRSMDEKIDDIWIELKNVRKFYEK